MKPFHRYSQHVPALRIRGPAFALLAWVISAIGVFAAPVERDLGQGLRYFRLQQLPGDLPPRNETGRIIPSVIDVRYLAADETAATAFDAWLRFRASPRSPVFVLANGETSPEVLRLLARHEPARGVMRVGVPAREFEPDIAVKISREDERRAYDALLEGASITSLLTDNPDKVRNDEASLSRDRLAEASAEAASDELAPDRPRPPLDAALQRAMHLHRALLALRKL